MNRQWKRGGMAVCLGMLLLLLASCGGGTSGATDGGSGEPTMRFIAPAADATVQGPNVTVELEVENWELVDAGSPMNDDEGHLHLFINVPASSIPTGEVIPSTDQYIHLGTAPYTSRELELEPGEYTITAVMGDSSHQALDTPVPQSITFTVE
ncbi:MAG: DUF4399 domain-containing protein [Chloroflexales bacterium]|nr:DUF4399 domain-containing protein [Chloroflexales bacterium]